jgi:glycosyltransferase involved in cell wall biosynthesis
VLHVQKVAGIGGSERHLLTLLPRLQAAGLDVRMVALGTRQVARFVEPLRDLGVSVGEFPAGRDVNPLVVRGLLREIQTFRPDVVHTHLIHADAHGQIAARFARVPGVLSVHSTHRFYLQRPYRSAMRLAARLARRTIAISEHVSRFLRAGRLVRPERVRVVPYGIDVAAWAAAPGDRHDLRERFGIASDEFALGFASRLIPDKGHDFLFDALERLHGRLPHLRVLVAGDGRLRPELEARMTARLPPGVVRFLGFVTDVRAFMHACDALAFLTLPALSEGFGLAALEAMAVGRPVVATAVGALPELIVDGESGLVVRPGDIGDLVRALTLLATDAGACRRLGHGAHRRAACEFGLERMVERAVRVYGEVAATC